MLVSTKHQHESAMGIHMLLPSPSYPSRLLQSPGWISFILLYQANSLGPIALKLLITLSRQLTLPDARPGHISIGAPEALSTFQFLVLKENQNGVSVANRAL